MSVGVRERRVYLLSNCCLCNEIDNIYTSKQAYIHIRIYLHKCEASESPQSLSRVLMCYESTSADRSTSYI